MRREIHWPGCKRGRSCTLRSGADSSARVVRRKRWRVGDIIEGDEGYGVSRWLITAIGQEAILVRELAATALRGRYRTTEACGALWCRCWRKVAARKGGTR